MKQPLISIVTVCFNSAKTIRQTIESVLNQSYNNIEYILIDGKSTDDTLAIIQEYELRFRQRGFSYRYISEPDNGIYDAMNKGIKMATGELVGIINSDDWYELNACELIAKAYAMQPDIGIFAGTLRYFAKLDGNYYWKLVESNYGDLNFDMYLQHPTIFIKSDLYRINEFDTSYKIIADWVLLRKLYNDGVKVFILESAIANFRDGGASAVHGIKLIRERIRLLKCNPSSKFVLVYIKEYIKLYRKVILQKIKPGWFTQMRQRQMILSTCQIYNEQKEL